MSSPGSADEDKLYGEGGYISAPDRPGVIGTVGRFEVIRLLGEGGMGQVVLARDPVTGVKVAIKMLKPDLCRDRSLARRFLSEARFMYRMSHPNILQVMEVSRREEGAYYVVPYIDGGSLADRIDPDDPLSKEEIVSIARQVASALSYAHKKGIIHRDIKPANILLGEEGRVLVTDFGLARSVFNDSIIEVRSDCVEGTPAYLPPGAAEGKAEDTRCDIYALGCMLYEMLTGYPPYSGRSSESILKQIREGPPKPIEALNPAAPRDLVIVANQAMARELRDRYAEVGDMLADLDRIANNEAPRDPEAWRRSEVRKLVAKYAAGLLVGMGLAAWLMPRVMRWVEASLVEKQRAVIAGHVAYAGSHAGKIWVTASHDKKALRRPWTLSRIDMACAVPTQASVVNVATVAADGRSFALQNVSAGEAYWLSAFLDADGDGMRDEGEPASRIAKEPVVVGQQSKDVTVTLVDGERGFLKIRGDVRYEGTLTGTIRVVACTHEEDFLPPNDCLILTDGLVLHYGFDRDGGVAVADKSPRGLDGVIAGATWSPDGRVGGAYRLHGPASTIASEGTIGICGVEPRTIAFWSRVLVTHVGAHGGSVVGWGTCESDGTRFRVSMWESGDWLLWAWGGHYDWHIRRPVQVAAWEFHTVTYDGRTVRWYVNGEEHGTGFQRTYRTVDSPLIIGGASASMMVDEVMVWTRALPAEQVERLYVAAGGDAEAPVTVWQADAAGGSVLMATCCSKRRGLASISAPGRYEMSCFAEDADTVSVFAYMDVDGDGCRSSWEPWGNCEGKSFLASELPDELSIVVTDSRKDSDGDGISDYEEIHGAVPTLPHNADSDGDGLPDGWEVSAGSDPLTPDEDEDPDGDRLGNLREYQCGCSARDPDSDDDGADDAREVAVGSDPTDGSSRPVRLSGAVTCDAMTGTLHVVAQPVGEVESLSGELAFDYGFRVALESNRVTDTSASGNNGIVYGAKWQRHPKCADDGICLFDGWNDWIETPRILPASELTVALRFTAHAYVQAGSRLLSSYGMPRIEVVVGPESVSACVTDVGSESGLITAPYSPGVPGSLVYTYSRERNQADLWVNGTWVGSAPVTSQLSGDAESWIIGRHPDGGDNWPYYRGRVDRVLVWRRALSRAEIRAFLRTSRVYGVEVSKPGPFVLDSVPSAQAYAVSAFLDLNGNGTFDPREPVGAYGANPVTVTGDVRAVDFALSVR